MAVTSSLVSIGMSVRINIGTSSAPKYRSVSIGALRQVGSLNADMLVDVCDAVSACLDYPVVRYERAYVDQLTRT